MIGISTSPQTSRGSLLGSCLEPGQYQGGKGRTVQLFAGRLAVTTNFWEEVVRMENVL